MAAINGDFILAHGEEYQQCPYNLAHIVTNARLITHLDKCRRAYKKAMNESGQTVDMKTCRFNFVHQVPSPEIRHHESRCPDQYHVVASLRYHNSAEFEASISEEKTRREKEKEPRKYGLPDDQDRDKSDREKSSHKKKHSKRHKEKDVKPKVEENPWGSDAEDWEADSNGYEPGYNPDVKLQSDIVLYHPRGLSKSERKTFREEQRQRASQPIPPEMDVKPFSMLEVREQKIKVELPKPSTSIPKVKPEPVNFDEDEKEDGECSEEEFYGEDPFS